MLRLRPAFGRPEYESRPLLHILEPFGRPDRTANTLRLARLGISERLVEILAQERAEVADPLKRRRDLHDMELR